MKNLVIVLVWLAILGVFVSAQTGRESRPRVVTIPTPTAAPTDSSNQTSAKRPPVLIGDTKSNTQNQTTNKTEGKPVEDDEIIRIETNLVTMPVSVLDRDGRFVSGLKQQDFRIFENGVEQKIGYFASVEQPFTVILLLDVSPSTQYQINEIQDAAIAFVNQLRSNDKIMVISFDQRVHILTQPTNNRTVLRNAILETEFGDGTSLYDTVDYVIKQQLRQIEGRKAVVLFTDGVDTTSRRADYQNTVKEAEEADALFYPVRFNTFDDMQSGNGGGNYPYPQGRSNVGIGGIIGIILGGGNVPIGGNTRGRNYPGRGSAGSSRSEYETGRHYLEDLAGTSGGRMFEANNNLNAAFTGIAEELRRQYSVGYYPETAGQKGERRQIRVRVMRPNLVVRAKNSYIVGENDKNFAGK
jgi:Ca-activated chloride channel family protein